MVSIAPSGASVFSLWAVGAFDSAGSGSIIFSVVPTAARNLLADVSAIFDVSATGAVRIQARTSVATNQLTIQRGSWFSLKKIG
jgi:hypothetical protein